MAGVNGRQPDDWASVLDPQLSEKPVTQLTEKSCVDTVLSIPHVGTGTMYFVLIKTKWGAVFDKGADPAVVT